MVRRLSGPDSSLLFGALAALSLTALPALLLGWRRERRLRKMLEAEAGELREQAERQIKLRDEERRGRTRAEQRLRAAALPASGAGSAVDGVDAANTEDAGFVFRPIGTFDSCYRTRCGTPRQGGVVADSLAVLRCSRDLNPTAALEGFADYSHCWVLYVFHENTNLQREGKTVAARGQQRKGRIPAWQGLCMKVAPPRCPELRVGVLSCRTPHRPNPIGLSLARIVRVNAKEREVVLAGLDVVDGTPCLDLKPYLPSYEAVPSAIVPKWVQRSYEEPLMRVDWAPEASDAFTGLFEEPTKGRRSARPRCWPFDSAGGLRSSLEGTLALDIRSPNQKGRHKNPGPATPGPFFTGDLWFHELHVTYSLLPADGSSGADATVRVEKVELRPADAGEGGGESLGAEGGEHEDVGVDRD